MLITGSDNSFVCQCAVSSLAGPLMDLVKEVKEDIVVETTGDLLDVYADHGRC